MAIKVYEETYIQDIANAIREKNGKSNTYLVSEMGAAIRGIEVGSGVSSSGNEDKLMSIIDGTITDFFIPDTINNIRAGLFYDCDNLVAIAIPSHITSIGENAFNSCDSLIGIKIDGDVVAIDPIAFNNCSQLADIYVPWLEGDVAGAPWAATNATVHYDCNANDIIMNKVLYVSPTKTSIANSAYYNSANFTEVIIPDSVITIGSQSFHNCQSIKRVVIGNGVTSIGTYAFRQCYGLVSVIMGDNVATIGTAAFLNCTSLASIVVPASITNISSNAFKNTALTDVYYKGTEEQWSAISIGSGNDALLNATIHYNTLV